MSNHRDFDLDRRQFVAGAAALLASTALAAAPALAQGAPRKGGVLRVSVARRPNHMSPLKHVNEAEYMLSELTYSSLTRLGRDMKPIPDLASAWETTDAKSWNFKLRDAQFHGGQKVTAKDVVASFRAMMDPKVASAAARNIGPIEKVEDVDAATVRITTSVPYADLPAALAYTNAKIAPAAILDKDFNLLQTEDHGSGPFKLKTFEAGRLCRVERFDNYFTKDRPHLDAVEQIVYPDANAEVAAFLNKANDLILEIPGSDYERVAKTAGVTALRTPSGRYPNLVLGCDTPPFNDPRVREALGLAIDREQVVALVLDGFGQPAHDNPISPAYRFAHATEKRQRDVNKAKQLLAAAGHPNGLDVTLIVANSPAIRERLAVTVRELTRAAGFRINVQLMPYDTYLAQIWRKGNFYVGFYNMQPTVDGIFKLLYTSDAAWNETRWNNKAFDELVTQARAATDDTARARLYAEAQTLIAKETPAIVPCFMDLLAAHWGYVQNYFHHPRGAIYYLEQVWMGDGAPKRT